MRHFKRDNFDYSTVLNVVIDMKPVILQNSPNKHNPKKLPSIEVIKNVECIYCLTDITCNSYVKCTQCTLTDAFGGQVEVTLCIHCFQMGAESGKHKRGHNYKVIDKCGPSVFKVPEPEEDEEMEDEWGVFEETRLLELAEHHKIVDWAEVSLNEFGKQRSVEEARSHLQKCFINGVFGEHAMSKVKPHKIHVTGLRFPETYNGDLFQLPDTSKKVFPEADPSSVHVPLSKSLRRFKPYTSEELENVVCRFSNVHIDHQEKNDVDECYITSLLTKLGEKPSVSIKPEKETKTKGNVKEASSKKRRTSPKKEDKIILPPAPELEESEGEVSDSEIPKRKHSTLRRRSSPKRVNYRDDSPEIDTTPHTYSTRTRKPKRARKFSISPVKRRVSRSRSRPKVKANPPKSPPQTPNYTQTTPRRKSKDVSSFDVNDLDVTTVNQNRVSNPYLNFFTNSPPLLNKQQSKFLDYEDLVLVAYNPKRDDFEHEYRNSAEQFICRIFLNGDTPIESEIDLFKTAVRIARVQRYNRILERRITNHSICREHQLLHEFLNIVKTNVNERNKYHVFGEESFPSKKRADECRPFFAKLRRVLDREELAELADNIGEMEALMNRIKVLRALQTSGTTELKGRFKSDFTPGRKRKKARKSDYDVKKAELRWNRIKKWNKQNKDE